MDHDIAQNEIDYSEESSARRANAALNCVRRGWPVVPLHDVTMGFCSCGDTSEKHMSTSAGKHPLANGWGPGAIRDESIVTAMFAGRPSMNFGIKTGLESGVWALDVDPVHEGDKRLAELTKEHGALPDTYTQRTGSGGLHHLFSLPADFTPTNSKGSLPVGLDVRGEGGFIVAAPCRSGVGAYEILLDLPVAAAPDWLLEMIRPRVPVDVEHRAALEQWDNPLLAGQNDRLVRYGHAAMLAELALLEHAVPGSRGSTAHRVACNLIELINSPWSGVTEDVAKTYFGVAAERAMRFGGGFDQREAWGAWGSAARKIGARGRAAPDVVAGGVLLGWNQLGGVPPFSPNGSPQLHAGPLGIGTLGTSETPNGSVPPMGTGFPTLDVGPAQGVIDLVPSMGLGVPSGNSDIDPVQSLISKFLDSDALAALPPPEWLIKDWIPAGGLIHTVGQPGHGKSFVALDQAMHVALGREWHGFRVRKARVGYMVAEGASGMGQRVKAWCKRFNGGAKVEGITFIPFPIQAGDNAAWEVWLAACVRLGLEYIVFDTQARITVGMEENSAKEMGIFVEQVERLRRATGATINIVHHQDKGGRSARGSSAMHGAVAAQIDVTRAGDRVTSMVTKQKDAEIGAPLTLQLVSEHVGYASPPAGEGVGWAVSAAAEPIWAGVLVEVDQIDAAKWAEQDANGKVLMVLADIFPHRGATQAQACAEAVKRGLSKTSAYRAWDALQASHLIAKAVVDDVPTGKWVVVPVEQRPRSES